MAMIPAGCPWDGLTAGTVRFCEPRLCAWVVEPSNAWSSVAYVIVGVWLMATHSARARDARLWVVAIAEVLIGIGSFAFHGTGSFVGEFIDQVGMFMLSCLILSFAAGKSMRLSSARTAQLYVATTVASSLSLLVVRPLGIPLFAVELVAGLGWEIAQWRRAEDRAPYRLLFAGIGVFLFSFVIWTLDITRIACHPDNHFVTGHAVWHVLNALSIERLYRFYAASFRAPAPVLAT
ncbi:Hypothetical protein A7982_11882 [Minicystis rosea]|nr:Hypothetical protein A7982_11882 [Minicystis rosea]